MDIKFDFSGKVALITGSAGGLGKETAVEFAQAGAKVVIGDVKVDLGKKTAEEINAAGGEAIFAELDVTSKESVDQWVKTAMDTFGGIDMLVNVAGLSGSTSADSFPDFTQDLWDITYKVNLRGQVYCVQAVYDIFKEQGHGKVVNVSSIAGKMPVATLPFYGASKAGSLSLTKSLAYDMAAFNVNVNAVCPGWIWTPIYNQNAGLDEKAAKMNLTARNIFDHMVQTLVPLKREQTEEDIAVTILFLCSEAAKNINGQAINVDGGAVVY